MKQKAKILDATAGNRSMWKLKDSPFILYVDIERELEICPDKVLDCTQTDFPDKYFNMIFFDPPHLWGKKVGNDIFCLRNREEAKTYYKKYDIRDRGIIYYGNDKYETKTQLLSFIHRAQKEFYRILQDNGSIWVKWNTFSIPIWKIIPFFKNWIEMLRIPVLKVGGKTETYWIMFMKKLQSSNNSRKVE